MIARDFHSISFYLELLDFRRPITTIIESNRAQAWWQSGTGGQGASPYHLTVQSDSNAVLYDGASTPLWQSGTSGQCGGPGPGFYAALCVSTTGILFPFWVE